MSGIAGAIVLLLATPATAQAGLCDWVGGASNNWESTSNWGGDCAFGNLPGLTDDIRIPAAAARFPTLSTAQSFRGMQIEAGAVMTITASGEATLSGDSAVTGTIRSLPGSRLTLAPSVSGSTARFASSQVIQGELRLGGAGLSSGILAMDGSSRLTISSTGSLVLGAGFAGGSDWNFQGQLDNRGLISMAKDLSINAPGAAHTSTGEIRIAAGASLAFLGGPTQRVTLGGSIVLTASASPGAPAELIVNGGTFIHLGGTLTGTGAMALRNGLTGTLTGDLINRLGELSVRNSSLTGTAKLDNRGLLTLDQSVIGSELSNAGLITSRLTNTLSGKVTTLPGSTLQLLPNTANEPVWLQVDKGLENNGTLDLSSAAGTSNWRWYVTSPVLTNTATGQINVALSSAKAIFSGQILNQGTLNVLGSLTISRTGKTHSNSGVMLLQGQTTFAQAMTSTGSISQTGDLFSVAGDFVNLGTYLIGAPVVVARPSAAEGFRAIARAGLVANRPGGTININQQADLEAELLNQGTLNVQGSLTISRTGKTHSNSGVMLLQGQTTFAQAMTSTGSISQSGDLFSVAGDFVNLGTYSIGAPVFIAGPSAADGFRIIGRSGLVANRLGGIINVNSQADLEAELLNQGTLNVAGSLTISRTGKTHTNSGVMLLQGQASFAQALTSTGSISQSGDLFSVAGDFVNLGTYSIGAPVVVARPSAAEGFRVVARAGLVANRPGGIINVGEGTFFAAPSAAEGFRSVARSGRTVNGGTVNVGGGTLMDAPSLASVTLETQFINQGTLNIHTTLEVSATGRVHQNSGLVRVYADASFGQALTSTGTISIPAASLSIATDYTQTSGLTALNGTLSVPEARVLGGALRGSGVLKGNLTNGALVAPGNSPGALIVSGDYTQLPAGSLSIELGGTISQTQYDLLNVSGAASLSGTLNVSLINAFSPANGDTFTFLSAGSRSGAFSALTGVALDGGKRLAPVYGPGFAGLVMQGRVTFLPQLLK